MGLCVFQREMIQIRQRGQTVMAGPVDKYFIKNHCCTVSREVWKHFGKRFNPIISADPNTSVRKDERLATACGSENQSAGLVEIVTSVRVRTENGYPGIGYNEYISIF